MRFRKLMSLLMGAITTAFAGMASAAEQNWPMFVSPSGFYTVQYPMNWRVQVEKNIVNIFPPGETGSVTISAYIGHGNPQAGRQLLEKFFKEEKATSKIQPFTGAGWQGFKQTFVDPRENPVRHWVALVAVNEYGLVLITWNELSPQLSTLSITYEKILSSLSLLKPQHP